MLLASSLDHVFLKVHELNLCCEIFSYFEKLLLAREAGNNPENLGSFILNHSVFDLTLSCRILS